MGIPSLSVPTVEEEFACAQLGDERRRKRLQALARRWSEVPSQSVLRSSRTSADAEAAYRFLNNDGFTYAAIVEAHVEQTYDRMCEEPTVIVAHDTTEVEYQGEAAREGLGPLRGRDQGFLAHVALAIAGDGSRRPLGVASFSPWVRKGLGASKRNGKRLTGAAYAKLPGRESERWAQAVDEVALRARDTSLVHVMDREADAYPLLVKLAANHHRFVVRMCKDRTVRSEDEDTTERLKQAIAKVPGLVELDVPVGKRAASKSPRKNKTFGPRNARVAKLEFAATTLDLKRPRYLSEEPEWLTLNVVHVREVGAPAGAEPVEWLLATTEPVETAEQVRKTVEIYRSRWIIEEYFKALKTGCAIEKRQHESLDALLKVVAICLPVAWRMLLLRTLARRAPDTSASSALTPTQIDVLRACSPIKLPARPNARQAFEALAQLGGHHKSNGDPGWIVLGRAMEHLLILEQGWRARDIKDAIDD
jgi:hypothetical protein